MEIGEPGPPVTRTATVGYARPFRTAGEPCALSRLCPGAFLDQVRERTLTRNCHVYVIGVTNQRTTSTSQRQAHRASSTGPKGGTGSGAERSEARWGRAQRSEAGPSAAKRGGAERSTARTERQKPRRRNDAFQIAGGAGSPSFGSRQ